MARALQARDQVIGDDRQEGPISDLRATQRMGDAWSWIEHIEAGGPECGQRGDDFTRRLCLGSLPGSHCKKQCLPMDEMDSRHISCFCVFIVLGLVAIKGISLTVLSLVTNKRAGFALEKNALVGVFVVDSMFSLGSIALILCKSSLLANGLRIASCVCFCALQAYFGYLFLSSGQVGVSLVYLLLAILNHSLVFLLLHRAIARLNGRLSRVALYCLSSALLAALVRYFAEEIAQFEAFSDRLLEYTQARAQYLDDRISFSGSADDSQIRRAKALLKDQVSPRCEAINRALSLVTFLLLFAVSWATKALGQAKASRLFGKDAVHKIWYLRLLITTTGLFTWLLTSLCKARFDALHKELLPGKKNEVVSFLLKNLA